MADPLHVEIATRQRVFARRAVSKESTVPLSLLDATTANFALTNASWLFEKPHNANTPSLADHLSQTLSVALDAYPQWCGRLKAIDTLDSSTLPEEVKQFPNHAHRYGRTYVHFGGAQNVGVEFVTASSFARLDDLRPTERPTTEPLWDRQRHDLKAFVPGVDLAHALKPYVSNADALLPPLMAVQLTTLSCGGFVLAAKIAHPVADISALSTFVQHWAKISRSVLAGEIGDLDFEPVFKPQLLDACAAGDINAAEPDSEVISRAHSLPLHRYDWWESPAKPPAAFDDQQVQPAGKAMPWAEWDVQIRVSTYTIHLSQDQIETIYSRATTQNTPGAPRISRHDAILAHIWSCIVRARELHHDPGPVHCDLTLGLRAALQLPTTYVGSPTMITNIEMSGTEVAIPATQQLVAQHIRQTITTVTRRENLAAHLHSVAYEQSPQRIWQAFLGKRHILVTTWARAGIYDVDLGLDSRLRYVDGVMPALDGMVTIKEGPPPAAGVLNGASTAWTCNGADITLSLAGEAMKRLLEDPLLLPWAR